LLRPTGPCLLAGIAICAFGAGGAAAQDAVPVIVAPVSAFEAQLPEQTRFGALRFIGGLQIDSPDRRLGGLSGLDISSDGKQIMMVSDIGDLFTATIDYDGNVPVGLSEMKVTRLPGEDGQPLGSKFGADAESLRARGGKGLPDDVLVGFERDNRVLAYPIDGNEQPGRPARLALPAAVDDLPYNKGLEGIAVVPAGAPHAGAVLAFSESAAEGTPMEIRGWMVEDTGVRDLALKRSDGFDLTDLLALPNGDLLALERRFNILMGVAMRIRRIRAAELDGPQPMAGEILFTGGMAYSIDNMEGIAVHRDEAGRTILTIISDDNFSALQRTLLLQFELL
jgi:hypothetical protein